MNGPRPSGRPLVSIVVAVHGNVPALDGLAKAVDAQDFAAGSIELIVVDNHPVRIVPPDAPFRVVHERRPGLSRARNTGIRQALGEYILITDPDSRPNGSWVRAMVGALDETGAYCAGGRVVPRFTGGRPTTLPADVLQLFVPLEWPEETAELAAPYWVVGCNLAIRRNPLPRFNTSLGARPGRHLSCEELEFTVRAQRDGHRVIVVPDAVVHRAVHPSDLTVSAVRGRALWHGVSIARLLALHPDAPIYDSYRLRDALAPARLASRPGFRAVVVDLLRIAGLRAERARAALRDRAPGSRRTTDSTVIEGMFRE